MHIYIYIYTHYIYIHIHIIYHTSMHAFYIINSSAQIQAMRMPPHGLALACDSSLDQAINYLSYYSIISGP